MASATWFHKVIQPEVAATPRERLAAPPDRVSTSAAGIVLLTVAFFSALVLAGEGVFNLPHETIAVFIALVLLALITRSPVALHITIFCLLASLAYRTREFGTHPFPLLNALLGYGIVVLASRRLRESIGWLHTGSLEIGVRRLMFAASAASVVALPVWHALADPDLGDATIGLAEVPVWALPPIGLFFVVVNAGAEEAAFRGVLMDALHSALGPMGGLFVQAAGFGLVHYVHGVPNGVWGAVLSGVYGILLGVIRLRAQGMAAPWVAHAITDTAIFVMLVMST